MRFNVSLPIDAVDPPGEFQTPEAVSEIIAAVERSRASACALTEHPARTIWTFTSGGPIAVLANALLEAPLAQTFKLSWPLVNTGLTRLRLGQRGATLITYNAWPHLEHANEHHLVTLR